MQIKFVKVFFFLLIRMNTTVRGNLHLQLIPKDIWHYIALYVPALYRHNLARCCYHFNPFNGVFVNYRNTMRNSEEYRAIRAEEQLQRECCLLNIRVTSYTRVTFDNTLSRLCTFIENGNEFQNELNHLYLKMGPSKICIDFLTAIGILNVYKNARQMSYPCLWIIAARQFDNIHLHDEAILMLRQFDYNFINTIYENLFNICCAPPTILNEIMYSLYELKTQYESTARIK